MNLLCVFHTGNYTRVRSPCYAERMTSNNGWTFNPAREVWYARIGPDMVTEIKGTPGNPPKFTPFSPKALQAVRPW